ncbi:outer membrane protein assembly factor BamC [Thalassotalea sp. 1_MG-2023]|uniref:outer membrane protein assembly factor BamC n=1 Tax=Thalassotalea sp. 1_MG-2023 TaxID=3062680 RepID=UPI0026E41272|nr:outer membrane protein assembly factor BamC [Thalassotalea sp. 1_MG-2023]MDO6428398.1 outer membrane protein assembly factor BamC [Thalassotalea sp. 1_MG-2023]
MNRKLFGFSLVALAVAGCSNVSKKQASGDFEYAEIKEAKTLSIPKDLSAPKKKPDFEVPDNINHQGSIGREVDVRAPSLVLPVATSSRVESNTHNAKIWFDQVLEERDLLDFIYQALKTQLEDDGVGLDVIDAENLIYESQWYNREKESGVWLFEEVELTESFRFRYQFETKPHGRSVALSVELVDYMRTDQSGTSKKMALLDQERAEMAMLNEIVAQVDFQYRKQQRENRLMRANQKLVSMAENAQGQPAYTVEMPLDSLWPNMPIFFEDYGFTVTDLNESKKIYYVDFVKPDIGLWDKLWGDDIPVLELSDQQYQFVLESIEDDSKTTVTIIDEQGNALDQETLTRIFPVMEAALSFRDTY